MKTQKTIKKMKRGELFIKSLSSTTIYVRGSYRRSFRAYAFWPIQDRRAIDYILGDDYVFTF